MQLQLQSAKPSRSPSRMTERKATATAGAFGDLWCPTHRAKCCAMNGASTFVLMRKTAVGLSPDTPPFRKGRERMGHPVVPLGSVRWPPGFVRLRRKAGSLALLGMERKKSNGKGERRVGWRLVFRTHHARVRRDEWATRTLVSGTYCSPGHCSRKFVLLLGLQEGEKVGVDGVGFGGTHAVGEAGVDF